MNTDPITGQPRNFTIRYFNRSGDAMTEDAPSFGDALLRGKAWRDMGESGTGFQITLPGAAVPFDCTITRT